MVGEPGHQGNVAEEQPMNNIIARSLSIKGTKEWECPFDDHIERDIITCVDWAGMHYVVGSIAAGDRYTETTLHRCDPDTWEPQGQTLWSTPQFICGDEAVLEFMENYITADERYFSK